MECPPLPPKQTLSCLARKPLRSFFPFFFFFFFFFLLLHEVQAQAQAQVLGSLVPTYRKSGPGQVGISSYRIYIPTTIPKNRRFITSLVNLFFFFLSLFGGGIFLLLFCFSAAFVKLRAWTFFFYFLLLVRKKEKRENITGEGRTGWIPVRMEGGGVQCYEAHGYFRSGKL